MEDQTQPIPREALPPPPASDPARPASPPPPPPGPRREAGGGLAWVWLVLVVVFVAAFVAATYLIVARAEDDRPTGEGGPAPTDVSTTVGETTTTEAPVPSTVAPAELAVVILNGTTRIGWAGENVEALDGSGTGYSAAAADAVTEVDATTVYVAEGREADGAAVAAALGYPDAPVEPRPAESLATGDEDAEADVVVVLGADSVG